MVIDTSALTAILRGEPGRQAFLHALTTASVRLVSSVTSLEAHMVLEGRYGPDAGADLELFLYTAAIEIVPFDARQSEIAKLPGANTVREGTQRSSIWGTVACTA